MTYRIGIDTGGTFTDLAVIDEAGDFRMYKSSTTPHNYIEGIINCLKLCATDHEMKLEEFFGKVETLIVHGSTIATNTVIQWKGSKVGLICTKGHNAILWRREGNKQDIFNYYIPYPRPLVPPYLCREVTERIDSEGKVIIPLDEDSVRDAVQELKKWGVEAIGVCLLWSINNPAHERRIGEIIEEEWTGIHYSLSSEVQSIMGEYHRTSCVVFDSMLKPIMNDYSKNFRETLTEYGFEKEFLMVVSSGGIMTASEAVAKPVYTLFSGPAMGPTAGLFFAQQEGFDNCVTVDMGGTSFDVSTIIDGVPTITREAKIKTGPESEYPTGVTSVEVLTLGAGGGSIGWVDTGGLIRVGPRSAGADPGPACYGIGGEEPTVTDANIVLGYIDSDYFLGGAMKIDPLLSRKAIEEKMARPLKQDIESAAVGIHRVVNENMVGGILDMTVRRGIDPREFILVSGGGAGSIHAAVLARELGMKKVVIPKASPVLCAMGMLNADITFSYVASNYTNTRDFNLASVNATLAELEAKAKMALDREGVPLEKRQFDYYVAARYPMQVYSIDIPIDMAPGECQITPSMISEIEADFHDTHERRYAGKDPTSCVECTDWRVLGIGRMPHLVLRELSYAGEDASSALKGKRRAYFEEVCGFVDTPVYDGNSMGYGMKIDGPAIIEDPLTTIVVIPGSTVTINKIGSYIMDLS